jgi:uncharacterized protein YbaR (Trm112 family)
MIELDIGMLRCIYHNEATHTSDGGLRIIVTGSDNLQLLKCVGCTATYLVKAGIPHMLQDEQLSREDRSVLRRLRRNHHVG